MSGSYFIKNFATRISPNVLELYAKLFLSFSSIYPLCVSALVELPCLGDCSGLLRFAQALQTSTHFCLSVHYSLLLMCRKRWDITCSHQHSSKHREEVES